MGRIGNDADGLGGGAGGGRHLSGLVKPDGDGRHIEVAELARHGLGAGARQLTHDLRTRREVVPGKRRSHLWHGA